MKDLTVWPSETHELKTGCGNLYIHIIFKDKERTIINSIRAAMGKSGGCARAHLESNVALINTLIKHSPHGVVIKALTAACGHTCQEGHTCHDLMIRLVIEQLMKVKL